MKRPLAADWIVLLGQTFGVEVAEQVYFALASEPTDAHGQRVDWLTIQARISARKHAK